MTVVLVMKNIKVGNPKEPSYITNMAMKTRGEMFLLAGRTNSITSKLVTRTQRALASLKVSEHIRTSGGGCSNKLTRQNLTKLNLS